MCSKCSFRPEPREAESERIDIPVLRLSRVSSFPFDGWQSSNRSMYSQIYLNMNEKNKVVMHVMRSLSTSMLAASAFQMFFCFCVAKSRILWFNMFYSICQKMEENAAANRMQKMEKIEQTTVHGQIERTNYWHSKCTFGAACSSPFFPDILIKHVRRAHTDHWRHAPVQAPCQCSINIENNNQIM